MNKFYGILASGIMTSLLFGCAGQPLKIVSLTDQSTIDKTSPREIVGSAQGLMLFNIIPIDINDRQQQAYEQMLQKVPNDSFTITDIKIQESWKWAFIGITYRTTLTAMAYPKIAKGKVSGTD